MSQDSETPCHTVKDTPDTMEAPPPSVEDTPPINSWLYEFCRELGYHNLNFLTTRSCNIATAAHSASEDGVDGCIGVDGFKLIKAIVASVLESTVGSKMKRECYGCKINHPSQIQHGCLYEPTPYYFDFNYEEFTRTLFKPEFKHIIVQALNQIGLKLHPLRIQGAVDAILCELRSEPYVVAKLKEITDELVDEKCEKLVYDCVDSWSKIC